MAELMEVGILGVAVVGVVGLLLAVSLVSEAELESEGLRLVGAAVLVAGEVLLVEQGSLRIKPADWGPRAQRLGWKVDKSMAEARMLMQASHLF